MSTTPQFAPDAAIALGIASTALPFAGTSEEAAERWLRALRLKGEVALAFEALGASEGPLQLPCVDAEREHSIRIRIDPKEAVSRITERAVKIAYERNAKHVATTDLLMAVMDFYGAAFDRVLHAHGTARDELIEQLGAGGVAYFTR